MEAHICFDPIGSDGIDVLYSKVNHCFESTKIGINIWDNTVDFAFGFL
mgnify:CR=1 FL=1